MNKKAQKFVDYINDKHINAFGVKEQADDMLTTLFYSNIKLADGLLLKSFILIDKSQNILIRVQFKDNIQAEELDVERLNGILNELNQKYPIFKFYYDPIGKSVVLEMIHIAHDDFFDPEVVYSHIVWIVNYASDILKQINEINK